MSATRMFSEIQEIPDAARRLRQPDAQEALAKAARDLTELDPKGFVTIARGSSDHAAHAVKYAVEILTGRPVASIGPSIASVYGAPLKLNGFAALAISQSGGSPDLCALSRAARDGGAHVLALTNTLGSPLTQTAQRSVDIMAGPENAVAATKSYVNSILAPLWILAKWQGDAALIEALCALPDRLDAALEADDAALVAALSGTDRLIILGRGPSEGIARECALKAMEICGLPAIGLSTAEAMHGPSMVMRDACPVLILPSGPDVNTADVEARLGRQNANLLRLPGVAEPSHRALPAIEALVRVYGVMEQAARARGIDPDRPENLEKVTRTM